VPELHTPDIEIRQKQTVALLVVGAIAPPNGVFTLGTTTKGYVKISKLITVANYNIFL
jgi:hypothetical protein